MEPLLVLTSGFPRFKNDALGGGSFVFDLCSYLKAHYKVHVISPYITGTKKQDTIDGIIVTRYKYLPRWVKDLTGDGAIIQQLRNSKFNYLKVPFLFLFMLIQLVRTNKKIQANKIHVHWMLPQGLMAVMYKTLFNRNVKLLLTVHGGEIWSFQNSMGRFLKSFIIKRVDSVTVVSNAIKQELLKLGCTKDISIIPMGIDTQIFTPDVETSLKDDQHRRIRLLFVGFFNEKKGISYLLDAMPRVVKKHPNVHLTLIGKGPLLNRMKTYAEQLRLLDYVSFLGAKNREELPNYFKEADIFVGPSIRSADGDQEGLPVVYMEAMASGCILIGTDLPGNLELIRHKVNGFIVEQKNAEAISEQIINLIENPQIFNDIKHNARQYIIDHNDWRVIGKKYNNLIHKLS